MIIPFKAWHLDMMRLSNPVRDLLGKYPSAAAITTLANAGFAYTIIADDRDKVRILGVVGAVPIENGKTAEVFVVAAEDRVTHQLTFVKAIREVLGRAKARFAIIEAVSGEGVPARWFEWLGFKRAGPRWVMEGAI